MPNISHKWVLGLGMAGLLIDLAVSHPMLQAKNEYQYKGMVPPHSVLEGFASERQWLFAHRKFRDQCVLAALAAEEKKQPEGNVEFTSARSHDGFSLAHLRMSSTD
jgi:hypothetical protein